MDRPQNIASKNVPGKYYVDKKECIMCQVCVAMGAGFFEMDWEEETAYVVAQPSGKVAVRDVREAMLSCPADAIKDDGEEDNETW